MIRFGYNGPATQMRMKIFKPGLRSAISLLVIAILVMVLAWLGPRALSLYEQVKGGSLLEQALQAYGEGSSEAIPCTLEPATDSAARTQLEEAVQLLSRSTRYNPELSQAYLLLGRAECLLGEFDKAAEALRMYNTLRPNNPLGHLEAWSLYTKCNNQTVQESSKSFCASTDYLHHAKVEWRQTRMSSTNLIEEGDRYYNKGDYAAAARDYHLGFQMGALLTTSNLNRWKAAAIASGLPIPNPAVSSTLPLYQLQDEIQISGDHLHWMRDLNTESSFGAPLADFPGLVPGEGVMWWEGIAAVPVQFHCQADYTILFRAKHFSLSGSSGLVDIEVDFKPLAKFELGSTWQDLSTRTSLLSGPHLIGIRYFQDLGDVIVQQLHLIRNTTCASMVFQSTALASPGNEAKH